MVLIHPKLEPTACREFEATIYLLFHANQIHKGFQATVHIGNVVQTAYISYMDRVRENNPFYKFFYYYFN